MSNPFCESSPVCFLSRINKCNRSLQWASWGFGLLFFPSLLQTLSVLKLFHSPADFTPRKTFQGISLHFFFFLLRVKYYIIISRVLYPHPNLITVAFFLPWKIMYCWHMSIHWMSAAQTFCKVRSRSSRPVVWVSWKDCTVLVAGGGPYFQFATKMLSSWLRQWKILLCLHCCKVEDGKRESGLEHPTCNILALTSLPNKKQKVKYFLLNMS